ncbi:acyl-CoA dehydrogenase [Cryobacterium sp. LW097]|uniref:acyl-CoA dehydrogenase n=2 Tax=Cryobacterium TaxID=69578 RepID=UPI000B4D39DF|nr:MULTISPECIES: acyl-CoA dehydrogenase [unclassified Cryobacterium]ASD20916.1 acyl-CoA dehydrogenase [Cryobacterium sp. LW097]TFC51929.1 acyl-CoA dehydrogenase [Cryobacterium sp. TMB3-1-2]TFC68702.1 acyl-CoA dehydrogenase [Cryobacterium sp. TMB3-15]TFC74675.1 acyl-CoA dehydrogenase [Cryobacterium sp. TMB3-10]
MTTQPGPAAAPAVLTVGGVSRSRGSRPPEDLERLAHLVEAAWAVDGNAERAIRFAVASAGTLPHPGSGRTDALFDALATVAAADLTAARVLEAHTDALTIMQQAPGGTAEAVATLPGAGGAEPSSWGVFAAEGPGLRVGATRSPGGWQLSGRKPWCSLAGSLSHALVTAHTTPDGEQPARRRLFAVDLADAGVAVQEDAWFATGLSQVPSGPVDFTGVPAVPVGDDGWYLTRPGFSWGGIQVAACWWGGAVGVARQLRQAAERREPDQILLSQLGAVDLALMGAGAALAAAAAAIDRGEAEGTAGGLLAARVRGLVARTVDEVLGRVGHALGPAPLALDARHARRVADLTLYVRQHHAERDDAALGRRLLAEEAASW